MVSDQDRDKLIAFTHGELDHIEAQRISARLNTDEKFRREFDALLAANDALEDFFVQPAQVDLSAEQIQKIMSAVNSAKRKRQGWYLGAGGAAMAACLALVLWSQQHTRIMEKSETAPAAQTATEIAGNSRGSLSKRIGGLAPPAEGRSEIAKGAAAPGQAMPKAKRTMKQELKQDFGTSADSAQGGAAFLAAESAEMDVAAKVRGDEPKIKMVNIKNQEAATNFIRQTLSGQSHCLESFGHLQSITVQVAAGGKITNITTQPLNKNASECLKGLFGESPAAFETTGSPGQITITNLKN